MENTKSIKFSSTHSRNPHDWEMIQDMDNRHCFVATNRGVKRRCGLIVTQLSRADHTVSTLLTALRKNNVSYNANDVRHALKRLIAVDVVEKTGTTYSLTNHGKAVWDNTSKKFV